MQTNISSNNLSPGQSSGTVLKELVQPNSIGIITVA